MTRAMKSWSYSAGERGRNRVRAFEDLARRTIFFEFYEAVPGTGKVRRVRISAGHNDRTVAKSKADELAATFAKPDRPRVTEATLETLFEIYEREVTPSKGLGKRAHDVRTAEMFKRCFGAHRKASTLNRRDWDRFIHERRRGDLRHTGRKLKKRDQPSVVRDRQIAYDLKFLLAVLNWATLAGEENSGPLLIRNPLKGLPIPNEENPRRPLVTDAEYAKLRQVSEKVDPNLNLALVLAHETGHRIGAIRKLRWSDIDLNAKRISWRAENDKIGMEHASPLSDTAVQVLEQARRRRRAIGDGFVFPSADDPSVEVDRYVTQDWWRRAAKLAGIKTPRVGWHSLRRKFATELKDVPLPDLCALGGWKSAATILACYQQPDAQTMREALARREQRRLASS